MIVNKGYTIYTRPDGSTFSLRDDEGAASTVLSYPENQGAVGKHVVQPTEDYTGQQGMLAQVGSGVTPTRQTISEAAPDGSSTVSSPSGSAGMVKVIPPGGGLPQSFAIDDPALDAFLKQGGAVLDYQGHAMQMQQFNGGWVGVDPSSGVPLPLNVIAGQGWQPNQQDSIAQFLQTQGNGSTTGTGGSSTGGTPQGGSPMDAGYFAEPFNEQFSFDSSKLADDPGYQFAMQEGMKALDRSASAKGTLNSGGQQKAAIKFGEGVASTFYNDAWNRNMAEFAQKRDIFRTNRSDIFGRYASLADVGLPATNATANYGQQSANNSGNLLTQQGNANAAGAVAGGNAYRNAFSNIGNAAQFYLSNIGSK